MPPPFLLNKTFLTLEVLARLSVFAASLIFRATYSPFVRRVQGSDWSKYAYPYEESQMFSEVAAAVILAVMALCILVIGVLLLRYLGRWDWVGIAEEVVTYLLGITLAGFTAYLVCELIKRMYGRPRPDYLARCFGSNDYHEWMNKFGWTSWEDIPEIPDCTGHTKLSAKALADGRMSFPSAHSTLSFALMGYVALWTYSKLCLFRNIGSWRLVIPFGIISVPIAVAVSRTSDYRHHPSDVVAGTLLGCAIAWICCAFYFPLEMKPAAQAIYDRRRVRRVRERFSYREAVRLPQDQVSLSDIEAQHLDSPKDREPKGASGIPSTVA